MGRLGVEGFRWTRATGTTGFGGLAGRFRSEPQVVSGDGSIVVGSASGLGEGIGFIWDAQHGMRSLQDALENEFGLDLNGWRTESVTGISADGRTSIGQYGGASWVAHIPEPSTLCLPAFGALTHLRRR